MNPDQPGASMLKIINIWQALVLANGGIFIALLRGGDENRVLNKSCNFVGRWPRNLTIPSKNIKSHRIIVFFRKFHSFVVLLGKICTFEGANIDF